MSARSFTTLAQAHQFSTLIEHSGFLAFAQRAQSPSEALEQLSELKKRFPDATHHCWAYKIGPLYRFNDDGEPGGTAGAPIFRAIEGQGLDQVMVVVVRFYGGTKLGTGGLARAYGGTAAECLRSAQRHEVRPRQRLKVSLPFEQVQHLYQLLSQFDLMREPEEYSAQGLTTRLLLYPEDVQPFQQRLQDTTRGAAICELD